MKTSANAKAGAKYPVWTQPESKLTRRVRLLNVQRVNLTDKIARARKPERIEKLQTFVDEIDMMIAHFQALIDLHKEGVPDPIRKLALRVWQDSKKHAMGLDRKDQAK